MALKVDACNIVVLANMFKVYDQLRGELYKTLNYINYGWIAVNHQMHNSDRLHTDYSKVKLL